MYIALKQRRRMPGGAIAAVAFTAIAGCSGAAHDPTAGAVEDPQVYVEAVAVRATADDLATLVATPIEQLAARTDGSVLAAPHMLFRDEQAFEGGNTTLRWTITTDPDDDRARITIVSSNEQDEQSATVVVADGSTALVPTQLTVESEDPAGTRIAWVIRSEVVHDQGDLQAILQRKQRTAP